VSLILTPISPDLWQVENLQAEACQLLAKWVSSAEIIVAQIDCGNPIWLQSLGGGIGKSVDWFATSIQCAESTGRIQKLTWARNIQEARSSRHTMGYQIHTEGLRPGPDEEKLSWQFRE